VLLCFVERQIATRDARTRMPLETALQTHTVSARAFAVTQPYCFAAAGAVLTGGPHDCALYYTQRAKITFTLVTNANAVCVL